MTEPTPYQDCNNDSEEGTKCIRGKGHPGAHMGAPTLVWDHQQQPVTFEWTTSATKC